MKTNKKRIVRTLLIVLIALVVMLAVLFILEKQNVIDIFKANTPSTSDQDAQTTSEAPSAQSDFSDGGVREPAAPTSNSAGSSVITDNNGNVSPSTVTSNPQTSRSGEISVYSPQPNTVLQKGQEVSGASSLSSISYRIIDDISGVIATGTLQVVNGRFSGSIGFDTNATQGRIDIYATRADGVEFSNIEIPVRFK